MSELPKRPKPPSYINENDYTGDEIQWIEATREHEHAVAARAVGALRELTNYTSGDDMHEAAREAIVEIEASGWVP